MVLFQRQNFSYYNLTQNLCGEQENKTFKFGASRESEFEITPLNALKRCVFIRICW